MLQIKNIVSGYNKIEILKGVDLNVAEGEISAIIGPNGSGKSTILKSIFNLANVFSGQIFFRDKDITNVPTYKLILEGISYVPQGKQIFPSLTVLENLEMGLFVFPDKEVAKKKIEDIFLRFPSLQSKKHEYAFKLSGGQQQLVAIARALIQSPKLLLMDEPSLGLSPKMVKDVFLKIQEINKEGITILIVEQNARLAIEIADRTFVMNEGRVALTGGKEILENKEIQRIYFG
jgi:branched-chain amino acid transport system ATP-binding protein